MRGVAELAERFRRMPPSVADGAITLLIFVIGSVGILFFGKGMEQQPFRVATEWSILVFAAMSLPLAIRRRNLLAAYLLIETAAVFAGQTHLVVAYGLGAILVFNVLLYSVGEQTPWPVTAAATLGQLAYWFSLEFEVPSKNRTFLDDTLYLLPSFGFPAFADGQSAGGDDSMPTSRLASRRFSWSESSWQGRQWGGSGAESPPSSTSW